jgi:hypothetical protein
MTADNTAKVSGRRTAKGSSSSSTPKPEGEKVEAKSTPAEKNVEAGRSEANGGEGTMTDNVVKITARPVQSEGKQEGAIQLHQPTAMIGDRPIMPSDIEVADTITVAGVRPIAASEMNVFATYLNGRPISSSSLVVQEMLPGGRPIFVSDFEMVDGGMLPGGRPIMASNPALLQGSLLPGGRPIASNDIIDPEPSTLMGYLD